MNKIKAMEGAERCAMCLEEIIAGEKHIILTPCCHTHACLSCDSLLITYQLSAYLKATSVPLTTIIDEKFMVEWMAPGLTCLMCKKEVARCEI